MNEQLEQLVDEIRKRREAVTAELETLRQETADVTAVNAWLAVLGDGSTHGVNG